MKPWKLTSCLHACLVGALATGVVVLLTLLSYQAKPNRRGWRQVKVGTMHWTGVLLGTALTGLFSYVWLFVGSTRSDAETQMTILFWLIVTFGLGTIVVGWGMYLITARALRWRGKSMVYANNGGEEKRTFQDVVALELTFWGHVAICFNDGSVVRLDPFAVGARELIDAVADHLNALPSDLN